jgi:hypothetical protein
MTRLKVLIAFLVGDLVGCNGATDSSSPTDPAPELAECYEETCDPTGGGGSGGGGGGGEAMLTVSVTGPGSRSVTFPTGTWTASVSGGVGPYYYFWYWRPCLEQGCFPDAEYRLFAHGWNLTSASQTFRPEYAWADFLVEVRDSPTANYVTGRGTKEVIGPALFQTMTPKAPLFCGDRYSSYPFRGDSAGTPRNYIRNACTGNKVYEPLP